MYLCFAQNVALFVSNVEKTRFTKTKKIHTDILNGLKSLKKQRCRNGVINDFVSWWRHLLVSFLFHDLTSYYIPLHFIQIHLFIFQFGPNKNASHTRMRAHTNNAPFTCALYPGSYIANGVVQCSPLKRSAIYCGDVRREKNDRLVSVHTSVDCGDAW